MFQNMKVDIVYYKTNSDFEMEFNLCGCCRMRLLTDKATDRKLMVHSLARAVSRSRIIMVVGPLFGEEGSIATTASAIGSSLEKVDNKLYGIRTDAPINIIAGATPLVTSDGFFGGCIIERGPQTMILLSESRTVRKTIVENLIHPYISELYAIELKNKAESIIESNTETQDSKDVITNTAEAVSDLAKETVAEGISEASLMAEAAAATVAAANIVKEAATLVSEVSDITDNAKEPDELFLGVDETENIEPENGEEIVLLTDYDTDTESEEKIDLIDEIFEEDEDIEPLSDDIQLLDDVDMTYEADMGDEDIELVESNLGDADPVPFEIAALVYDENQNPEEEPFLEETENIEEVAKEIIIDSEEELDEDYFYAPETERELVSIVPEIEPEEIIPENIKFTQDDEIFDEDDSIQKKVSSLNIPIMVLTALLFVLILGICALLFLLPRAGGVTPMEYVKDIFETLFK